MGAMGQNEDNDLFVLERWERIRSLLDHEGRATVQELAERFGVSRSTIRRDLQEMHKAQLLVRTRGGAVRPMPVAFDRTLAESGTINVEVKERIGRAAADLVSDGETVLLDAGSTTLCVVQAIQSQNLTLVTNSFDAATTGMSRSNVEVIMLGGSARRHGGSTVGPLAEEQIIQFQADTAILGMNAISVPDGLTTPSILVAQVKKAMIRQSRRLIVVADHSKLGRSALCKVAPVSSVSTLVTDAKADEEDVRAIEALGVEVIRA